MAVPCASACCTCKYCDSCHEVNKETNPCGTYIDAILHNNKGAYENYILDCPLWNGRRDIGQSVLDYIWGNSKEIIEQVKISWIWRRNKENDIVLVLLLRIGECKKGHMIMFIDDVIEDDVCRFI